MDPVPSNPYQDITPLIAACNSGDRAAWNALIERYGRLVYSVPRRYGLPPEACDDVFQDVFAIVLRELPQLREPRTLPKWLATIAARESLRTVQRTRAQPSELPDLPAGPLESEELDRFEQRQLVREALDSLGEPCRTLLRELFTSDRPDYEALAARLQVPIGSIGPTRGRCLKKLAASFQQRSQKPGP